MVCILSAADGERDLIRFKRALNYLGLKNQPAHVSTLEAPPVPDIAATPRQARFGRCRRLPLERALGRIVSEPIAPYPPGVPVAAAGEVLDEKILAYLRKLCYDDHSALLTIENGEF